MKESFVTDIERCRESLRKINEYIANVDEYVKDKQVSIQDSNFYSDFKVKQLIYIFQQPLCTLISVDKMLL